MDSPDPLGPELLAQIEAYYDGTLSDEAAGSIRKRLSDDPALAQSVARWERVYRQGVLTPSATDLREREELRAKFNSFKVKQPPVEARVRKMSPYTWLAVAASVLFFLIAAWWIFQRPAAPTAQLAETSFAWLPRQEALLGPDQDAEAGLLAYDRQEYVRAYPLLMAGVASGRLDSVNLLYAGVAALGADLPVKARKPLTELLQTGRYPFEESDLRYYLALVELEGADAGAAIIWLNEQADLVDRNRALLAEIEALRK